MQKNCNAITIQGAGKGEWDSHEYMMLLRTDCQAGASNKYSTQKALSAKLLPTGNAKFFTTIFFSLSIGVAMLEQNRARQSSPREREWKIKIKLLFFSAF